MSVSPAPAPDPRTVLDTVVFRCGDVAVTRLEVRRWAARFDPSYRARVARRAALGALELAEDPTLDAEVEADASEFRYARELESAEALMEWLVSHGVTVDAWWESIRRSVLERRFSGRPLPSSGDPGTEQDEDAEAVELADLVVADVLSAAAEALARRFALAQDLSQAGRGVLAVPSPVSLPVSLPVSSPRDVDQAHDALERSWRSWHSALMTAEALQQSVDRERLSWIVLDFVQSTWPSADAAREAISRVLVDNDDLTEVAREAAADVDRRTCLLSEVAGAWHDELLTAARGDVVGPLASPPNWVVIRVGDKRAPTLDEPLVRSAAERDLERRATAPLVEAHVTWPARLP